MGIALPQLAPASEDRASGAQVIDGSLKFNGSSKNRLDRTVSSVGNQKTWTWSGWIKRNKLADEQVVFTAGASTGGTYWAALRLNTDDSLQFINNSSNSTDINVNTTQRFRDVSSWYHILLRVDISNTTTNDRIDLYINGVKVDDFSTQTQPGTGVNTAINYNHIHAIGGEPARNLYYDTLQMSQVYLIDGQALGPENFGFTDPLTNTWRPKKFSGNFTVSNPSAINDGTDWNSYFTGDYDQNHGWGTAYQSSHAFDGDLNTKAIGQANGTGLTWTAPGGAIGANATTIRIYGNDDACPDDYLKINGTNYGGLITQGFTAAWTVLKGSGAVGGGITQLESIYLRDNSAGNQHYRWAALEIDGVILVANQNDGFTGTNSFYLPMDGNSPIGDDLSNPNPVNDGTVWSDGGISDSNWDNPLRGITNGFNGILESGGNPEGMARPINANVTATWNAPAGGIPFTTLQLRAARDSGSYSGAIKINGVDVTSQFTASTATLATVTITGVSSPLTKLELTAQSGVAQPRFTAIFIDGVDLRDDTYGNGWTPVNFGGSVALDNPIVSGARPILNTDGGGNVARPGVFGSELNQTIAVTVSNASGNNKYYLDGSLTPNLAFIRGSTITFNTGDSSGTGHPFKLSSTNASGSGGSEYTDGVAYYIWFCCKW